MQFTHWGSARITTLSALAGALIATGIAFSLPDHYVSMAVIQVSGADSPAVMSQGLARILSRSALTTVILNLNLYPGERSRMTIEDVIDKMKKNITVVPVGYPQVSAYTVQFNYDDRSQAQRVTEELVGGIIDANLTIGQALGPLGSHSNVVMDLIDPPTFPFSPSSPNRTAMAGAGLFSGLFAGMLLAWMVRHRRSRGICPTCGHPIARTA